MTLNRPRSHLSGPGEPPNPGGSKRTSIPDTFEGIKTEVVQMGKTVVKASRDEFTRRVTEHVLDAYGIGTIDDDDRVDASIAAVFDWTKRNFAFTNDPIGAELIKSPNRMFKELTEVPRALKQILGDDLAEAVKGQKDLRIQRRDFVENLNAIVHPPCVDMGNNLVCPKMRGDCDDSALLIGGMLASVGIEPRFALGGNPGKSGECEYFHVWVQGMGSSGWIDMDITRPESYLGWTWPHFGCVVHEDIFS